MKQIYSSHKSISLVELILVLTIIVLFSGIAVNTYPDISRKSKLTANYQNMLKVYNASLAFGAERQNTMPSGMHSLLKRDVGGPARFEFAFFHEGQTGVNADLTIGLTSDILTALGGMLSAGQLRFLFFEYNLSEVFLAPDLITPGHATLESRDFSIFLRLFFPGTQALVYIDPETAILSPCSRNAWRS